MALAFSHNTHVRGAIENVVAASKANTSRRVDSRTRTFELRSTEKIENKLQVHLRNVTHFSSFEQGLSTITKFFEAQGAEERFKMECRTRSLKTDHNPSPTRLFSSPVLPLQLKKLPAQNRHVACVFYHQQ